MLPITFWSRAQGLAPLAARLDPSGAEKSQNGRILLKSRTAFSLLEVILALAILAGSLAALGEVMRMAGQAARLTESETQLLSILASRAGTPISRQELAVLTAAGVERSVDVQVTRLRRKIERDPREPVHLQTVRGVGYRLTGD